ncbi:MAG: PIG-L family deacetylase [Acidobacteriota bacterium]
MTQPIKPARRKRNRSPHTRLFGTGDLNPTTRCVVIVAHPADEIVGAGCLISKLVDVSVLHVTNGAPQDLPDATAAGFKNPSEYARARKQECLSALAIANVPEDRVVDLNVPDHFASHCLADLTKRIAAFLQQSEADIVVTHPYEGGHPDHDASAFATHAALRLMTENGLKPPVVFEMALHPSSDFIAKVPEFLPGSGGETTTLLLDERSVELKRRMFECFETQRKSLQVSPVGPERFRKPSTYNFTAPPNGGKLHYENFDWAPSGKEWRSLASKALEDLFPSQTTT